MYRALAVNPQDVVDTANSQNFSKEGHLCLRVLAELDAFVHCSDDIRLAQELVSDEPRPNSNSECDAAVGSDSGIGNVDVLQKMQHQDRVAHFVTVVHVPLVRQASVLLQRVLRIMGTGVLFWATKLEVW